MKEYQKDDQKPAQGVRTNIKTYNQENIPEVKDMSKYDATYYEYNIYLRKSA